MVIPTGCNMKNVKELKIILPVTIASPAMWITPDTKNAVYSLANLKRRDVVSFAGKMYPRSIDE
jgi:hypothetical protein